jgi:gamma-glutamyltranspeptidase/glutathione hydrolase
VTQKGKPFLTVGSPGGATIITTVLQILMNRIDLGMTLPQAVAEPRASQRNAATTDAEEAFRGSPWGVALVQKYKEAYPTAAGVEIGAATGIEFTNPGRGHGDHGHGHGHWARAAHHGGRGHDHGGRNDLGFLAVAEPTRRGGGEAAVVKTGR